jgi:general secretion pathway protein N
VRVDTARPWTWLLAGAAGWGVLAWVLALVGMGERLPPLPEGAALAKPLPTLRAAAPSRIGPISQYSEIAQRPLFATDRRPKPFLLQGEGDPNAAAAFDYVLTSVMITPRLQMAIVQPPDGSQSLRVKLGDAPEPQPAWRLVSLNPRSATFEGPEGQKTLELRVFDGTGGPRPTPSTAATQAPAAQTVQAAAEANERPGPQGPAEVDASPGTPAPAAPRPSPTPAPAPANAGESIPLTPEAQMEAIRKRIQARREQLRREAAQQAQPPAK